MKTLPGRRYYWVGEYFATCCLLQERAITAFTSLYVVPAVGGSMVQVFSEF